MSCFIVSNKTIDFAIRGLDLLTWQTPAMVATYSTECCDSLDRLGAAMLHLNDVAYSSAYAHKGMTPDTLESVFYEYVPPRGATLVQCVKAATCWLYQCSEKGAQDSDLFRAWETIIGQMNGRIVSDLPEYDSTPWGHDERMPADTKQPFAPSRAST